MFDSMHVYEVRPRKDKRGFDLISDTIRSPMVHRDEAFLQNGVPYRDTHAVFAMQKS